MDLLIQLAVDYLQQYPIFGTIMIVMTVTRAVVKPIMSAWNAFVNATPWPEDNKWFAQVEASDGMKWFLYFLDWFTSIKVKPKS